MDSSPQHHPVFSAFDFRPRSQEPGFITNGLGVRTRESFMDMTNWRVKIKPGDIPEFNESYFEWVEVLSVVRASRGRFVMIELGAGYGAWIVAAAVALRQLSRGDFFLVAVEAEPSRFSYISRHLLDNGISPADHLLIQAAVGARTRGRRAWFEVGEPRNTYGASMHPDEVVPNVRSHGFYAIEAAIRRWKKRLAGKKHLEKVEVISLPSILEKTGPVDLLDMDIQGAELEVVEDSRHSIDSSVRRVHIGTHGREIEERLRVIFSELGWVKINDFATRCRQPTPFGEMDFQDGVQTWLNPKLARP
jgi:FkbM family methyltransferase